MGPIERRNYYVRDVEFQEDEIFDSKEEPIREYRLKVYRKDPNSVESILNNYQL